MTDDTAMILEYLTRFDAKLDRVAEDVRDIKRRRLFHVKVPNAATRLAMKELEDGKGKRFASIEAAMAYLNADD